MSSKPSFSLHQPRYPQSSYAIQEHHPHHAQLPPIPDLRFEYSYLRSIQHFITVTPTHVHDEKRLRSTSSTSQESVNIQWGKVVWVTMRDQVISPLLQGALWAIASYFLSPLAANFGSTVGAYTRSILPSKEGSGVTWLRSWVGNLGIGVTPVSATSKH